MADARQEVALGFERRVTPRYPLEAGMILRSIAKSTVSIEGRVFNLCSRGVLFCLSAPVKLHDPIQFTVDLHGDWSVELRCTGRVVRVSAVTNEFDATLSNIAATIERYEFVRVRSTAH